METEIKKALNTRVMTKARESGGGCINQGQAYLVDSGKVFIKFNNKSEAKVMFDGEYEGLKAIDATNTITVPQPIQVVQNPKGGAAIVLEYIEMERMSKFITHLGEKLAALHLHNLQSTDQNHSFVGSYEKQSFIITQFGFHTKTSCGYLAQDNTWCDDWATFFTRQRLDHQFRLLETTYGDREAMELWSQLIEKVPIFFNGATIRPSLLHGDLWSGNIAETSAGPIIFDPASFYGHSEYDLSIAEMFGGFNKNFYTAYHNLIPKSHGFEIRQRLYQLFHYLNHWNHFGASYRSSCIKIMKHVLTESTNVGT